MSLNTDTHVKLRKSQYGVEKPFPLHMALIKDLGAESLALSRAHVALQGCMQYSITYGARNQERCQNVCYSLLKQVHLFHQRPNESHVTPLKDAVWLRLPLILRKSNSMLATEETRTQGPGWFCKVRPLWKSYCFRVPAVSRDWRTAGLSYH